MNRTCGWRRNCAKRSSTGIKQTRVGGEWVVKPECGETERDTGRSVEALVARLPRMLSDSGRLMTGRAVATVKVRERERASAQGRPLSLGRTKPNGPHSPPRPPIHPTIHLSVRPFIPVFGAKQQHGDRLKGVVVSVKRSRCAQTEQTHSSSSVFHTSTVRSSDRCPNQSQVKHRGQAEGV